MQNLVLINKVKLCSVRRRLIQAPVKIIMLIDDQRLLKKNHHMNPCII